MFQVPSRRPRRSSDIFPSVNLLVLAAIRLNTDDLQFTDDLFVYNLPTSVRGKAGKQAMRLSNSAVTFLCALVLGACPLTTKCARIAAKCYLSYLPKISLRQKAVPHCRGQSPWPRCSYPAYAPLQGPRAACTGVLALLVDLRGISPFSSTKSETTLVLLNLTARIESDVQGETRTRARTHSRARAHTHAHVTGGHSGPLCRGRLTGGPSRTGGATPDESFLFPPLVAARGWRRP